MPVSKDVVKTHAYKDILKRISVAVVDEEGIGFLSYMMIDACLSDEEMEELYRLIKE